MNEVKRELHKALAAPRASTGRVAYGKAASPSRLSPPPVQGSPLSSTFSSDGDATAFGSRADGLAIGMPRVTSVNSLDSFASGAVNQSSGADSDDTQAPLSDTIVEAVAPTKSASLLRSLRTISNSPRDTLKRIYTLCIHLTRSLKHHVYSEGRADEYACNNESLHLMHERWKKLTKDFYNPKKDKYVRLTHPCGLAWHAGVSSGAHCCPFAYRFDLSKIPDIYDCIKYDCYHNAFIDCAETRELFR